VGIGRRDRKWGCTTSPRGHGTWRDLLGGQGARNVRGDDACPGHRSRAGRISRSPPRHASPTWTGDKQFPRGGLEDQVADALGAARGNRRASASGTTATRLLVVRALGARASRLPGDDWTPSLNLGAERRVRPGGLRRRPRTSASPGTRTGASSRCTATSVMGVEGAKVRGRDQARSSRTAGVKDDTELDVRCAGAS